MDAPHSHLSFIGIVDFAPEANWVFVSESVTDLLGYEPADLRGTPSLQLVHPDEFPRVQKMHYQTIQEDKAAVIAYLRLRHKDPYKGYVLCGISRTVVHNVLVGSVSFATPGAKALHNASTAQEITVITPHARDFEFRRWNDPSPMPPDAPLPRGRSLSLTSDGFSRRNPSYSPPRSRSKPRGRRPRKSRSRGRDDSSSDSPSRSPSPRPAVNEDLDFDLLPLQSFRTALILDRFSVNCPIIYCSNDLLLSTTTAMGRSFFDFVAKKDEEIVRSWMDVVKGWGVNERGQPSDGGFGYGKFTLLTEGRDSSTRMPEPPPSRHRQGSTSRARAPSVRARGVIRPRIHALLSPDSSRQVPVDAIFSAHSDGMMVILRHANTGA
ncbi:hypothetical protein PC9H_010666 [Pleurotus ostreatus]|uniref:PAS domain-containing protein n=2 Tax=Pleurotus TaxID=5320 RepID=A0A8H6ZK96_PLEOS|nr:uncharacterized protein PC9H_010666 [Pleurotus ostreatus]KAF7422510.1 hypothetical protein PC9H_010666 [Pleurotus ostreatus]KAG9227617.1 hypothetical protein CCMSSC00406_0000737 [Pleurotus cornucopiae]KAJ8691627.1 hypothetical protein PTI98_011182 [Pleurotus ostreatus]